MSVFKGIENFKALYYTACFNTFQFKTLIKADNVHDFTEISGISLFKTEVCPSKFQIGDIFFLTFLTIAHITHN